jgi:hypothetical protein
VKILSVVTWLYAHCSTVILRVLSLIIILPGDYPINRDIKPRTHKLLDALPGNTSQYVCIYIEGGGLLAPAPRPSLIYCASPF